MIEMLASEYAAEIRRRIARGEMVIAARLAHHEEYETRILRQTGTRSAAAPFRRWRFRPWSRTA